MPCSTLYGQPQHSGEIGDETAYLYNSAPSSLPLTSETHPHDTSSAFSIYIYLTVSVSRNLVTATGNALRGITDTYYPYRAIQHMLSRDLREEISLWAENSDLMDFFRGAIAVPKRFCRYGSEFFRTVLGLWMLVVKFTA